MCRKCPFCESSNDLTLGSPYKTFFNNNEFHYIKCSKCKIVYINPIPSNHILENIYSKNNYHKVFYSDEYSNFKKFFFITLNEISKYLNTKSSFLDYGCGTGYFLKYLNEKNFLVHGVEFETSTVEKAKKNSGANVMTIDEFNNSNKKFDFVYLGDVFEHLGNPIQIINKLIKKINKNGYLCVEGPIERNMSFANYCVIFNSFIKHLFFSSKKNSHHPYHLLFFNKKQQIKFFYQFNKLKLVKYTLYETGWPLTNQGFFKNILASISKLLIKLPFFKIFYGNRIRIILIKL